MALLKRRLPILTILTAIAGFLVGRMDTTHGFPAVTAIFVLLLALPSYAVFIRWLGHRRASYGLAILSIWALLLETVAVKTGLPYGQFHYSTHLGGLLFRATPWTVPFAYIPLVLGSLAIAWRYGTLITTRLAIATSLLVLLDLVLDPGAVSLGFWAYQPPGPWYGVPFSNYAGWVVTGLASAGILYRVAWRVSSHNVPPPALLSASLLLTVAFWTSAGLTRGLLGPAGIGIVLLVFVSQQVLSTKAANQKAW